MSKKEDNYSVDRKMSGEKEELPTYDSYRIRSPHLQLLFDDSIRSELPLNEDYSKASIRKMGPFQTRNYIDSKDISISSVSYTHLDVYKRQITCY